MQVNIWAKPQRQLFFGDRGLLTASDLIMVVKNNYHWGDSKRLLSSPTANGHRALCG
ncbi:MAG: hypothetical protein R3B47_19530 [Bacteroidia bacterium]